MRLRYVCGKWPIPDSKNKVDMIPSVRLRFMCVSGPVCVCIPFGSFCGAIFERKRTETDGFVYKIASSHVQFPGFFSAPKLNAGAVIANMPRGVRAVSRTEKEKLIELVRQNPVLYDAQLGDYKDAPVVTEHLGQHHPAYGKRRFTDIVCADQLQSIDLFCDNAGCAYWGYQW